MTRWCGWVCTYESDVAEICPRHLYIHLKSKKHEKYNLAICKKTKR